MDAVFYHEINSKKYIKRNKKNNVQLIIHMHLKKQLKEYFLGFLLKTKTKII